MKNKYYYESFSEQRAKLVKKQTRYFYSYIITGILAMLCGAWIGFMSNGNPTSGLIIIAVGILEIPLGFKAKKDIEKEIRKLDKEIALYDE